jgi:threonine dehydratase
MNLPSLHDIEDAAQVVYREFAATPQYAWGQLSSKLGATCWLKHENHTPVGAFKIRGGLTYFDQLAQSGSLPQEVISATRGNHGQSIGWAARAHGVACTIVVPHGNSLEKNAAMRALGVRWLNTAPTSESRNTPWSAEDPALTVPSFHAVCCAAGPWWEFFGRAQLMGVCPSARARAPVRPSLPSARWVIVPASSVWSVPTPPPTPTRCLPAASWKPR